ncbi:serine/threonine-protein kinase [Bacteroides sp. 519]|uniref:serine/threonine protein kinase n=1 Tax=Bacteroides sp. 519 TaxID=2302937 RepID=UPI0013CF5F79|nr:serine/threonine-protein kinase [Bacteroides sp. 519]NDV57868.1 serine/threonine protein kinase [Bacteroides sp. 519]
MPDLQQNTRINDRYLLKQFVGSGSFGEVWLAHDEFLGFDVAVKVYVSLDPRGIEEFKQEYRTAYGLKHEHLLVATHFDVWQQRPFLVLEYCPNGSAGKLSGHVTEDTIWRFIRDVSSGLAYLHDIKPDPIVHQDIKPDNVLVKENGDFAITDFGISRKVRNTMRKQSGRDITAGATGYMGPERFSKDPTPIKASDIWSLGASIYELAMDELPFCGMGGVMLRNGAEMPELPSKWSKDLSEVIHACMALEPWDRPTAQQLYEYAADKCKNPYQAVRPFWLSKESPKKENPEKENPKNKSTVQVIPYKRHPFVSVFLMLFTLISSFAAIAFFIIDFTYPSLSLPLLITGWENVFLALTSLSMAFAGIMLWKWLKYGYWVLCILTFACLLVFMHYITVFHILISFTFLLLVYGILKIKKNGYSTWGQLDNSFKIEENKYLYACFAIIVIISFYALINIKIYLR